MDILSVGEIVIDFLPGGPGVYIRKPGGAPANVAVAMSRLGRGAAFCNCGEECRATVWQVFTGYSPAKRRSAAPEAHKRGHHHNGLRKSE